MKPHAKVTHVNLPDKLFIDGKTITRTVHAGKESLPGVEMRLCPVGVLCERPGKPAFVIPFPSMQSFVLAPGEEKAPIPRKSEEKP